MHEAMDKTKSLGVEGEGEEAVEVAMEVVLVEGRLLRRN